MKKYLFIAVLVLLKSVSVFSQTEAQIGHYFLNTSSYNPAALASDGMISVRANHRQQWIGFENRPQTTYVGIEAPIKQHGVGLLFENDKYGLFSSQSFYAQYSYKFKVGPGYLSGGVKLGFLNQTFYGKKVNLDSIQSDYHSSSDPLVPKTDVNGIVFDAGVGVFYKDDKRYAGFSITNVTAPNVDLGDYASFKFRLNYLFLFEHNISLNNPLYVLKPSFLAKTDFNSFQVDLNMNLEYNKKFWGGLGYRLLDAVIFSVGMNLNIGLSVAYSYELPTTKIIRGTSGSHEFTVAYGFKIDMKKKSSYKSVRIL